MNTANLTFEQGVLVGAGGVALFLFILLVLKPWLRALFSGARISLIYTLGMRLRFNPTDFILDAYLELSKGGYKIPIEHVECLYMKYKYELKIPHDLAVRALAVHMNMQKNRDHQPDVAVQTEGGLSE